MIARVSETGLAFFTALMLGLAIGLIVGAYLNECSEHNMAIEAGAGHFIFIDCERKFMYHSFTKESHEQSSDH